MGCDTRANTFKALIDKNVMDEDRVILNQSEFDRLNDVYSTTANEKYGVDGVLFSVDTKTIARNEKRRTPTRIIRRAIANLPMFEALDIAVKASQGEQTKEVIEQPIQNAPKTGKPGVFTVWHGSETDIKEFKSEFPEGFFHQAKGGSSKAIFFSKDKAPSDSVYGKRPYQKQFQVTMDNPLVVNYTNPKGDEGGKNREQWIQEAIDKGHDGVIWRNIHDNFITDVYVSLDSKKIKAIEQPINKEIKSKIEEAKSNIQLDFEKILDEDTVAPQTTFEPIDYSKIKINAPTKEKVLQKMKEILDTLGVQIKIGALPEDIASMVDSVNRLITFAEGHLTDDNLTEEALHLVVDIIQQKNPDLFNKLMSQIWKYDIYAKVIDEYGTLPLYQKPDGSKDIDKLKKEAIAQVLVQKLLTDEPVVDKGFIAAAWEAITNFLKNTFLSVPGNVRDDFSELANDIMNTDFISAEDKKNIGNDIYYAKKNNRIQSSLYKTRKLFGTNTDLLEDFTDKSAEDIYNYIKKIASGITKVVEREVNQETGEMEDAEFYVTESGKKQRITSMLKEADKNLYANIDKSERAEALREAKMQKGTAIHKTIEDIILRYIDPKTGLLKTHPDLPPTNKHVPNPIYNRLEAAIVARLKSYESGTRFLTETFVVNEKSGMAGTVDFIAITPSKKVDILDWKTTDVTYSEFGVKKTRIDISPFNQRYWRNQLELYKAALAGYGLNKSNFRQVRAIPIVTETVTAKIDKNKPLSVDNAIITIANVNMGDGSVDNVKDFTLMDVPIYFEKTGDKNLDEAIKKLWGIYERIQGTVYPEGQKLKKGVDLQRISNAIREMQVKRTATRFTSLFNDAFARFNLLSKEELPFLDKLEPNQKFLDAADEDKLNAHLSELYDGIEFLSAFVDFPEVIRNMYPDKSKLTQVEKTAIDDAIKLGANSKKIREQLMTNAESTVTRFAKIYDINNVWENDIDRNYDGLKKFISSILHREEKSMQLASRLINAMTYLGKREARKYFEGDQSEFKKARKGLEDWAKANKMSVEEATALLFKWEVSSYKIGNDTYKKKKGIYYRNDDEISGAEYYEEYQRNKSRVTTEKKGRAESLIPVINSDFYELLKIKRKEFNEIYNEGNEKLTDLNYKGRNKLAVLKEAYAKEILPFLKANFDLAAFDKDYKQAYENQIKSIKGVKFDAQDPIADQRMRQQFLDNWEAQHDIYTSPKALTTDNWLLRVNQSKWQSEEYSNLLKPGNEELLAVYNLFTGINDRARNAGMLNNEFNPRRFVPEVESNSILDAITTLPSEIKASINRNTVAGFALSTAAAVGGGVIVGPTFGAVVGLGVAAKLLNDKIYDKFADKFLPEKGEAQSADRDLVTGAKKQQRKVAYKQEVEHQNKDLFYNYALWMDHIIKFEIISNYEERLKMTQMMEHTKTKLKGTAGDNTIAHDITPGKLPDSTEVQEVKKSNSTEEDLDKVLSHYLYSNSLEYKPSYYRLANALKAAAGSTYLGIKTMGWAVNVIGASSAGTLQKGKLFDSWDFEKAMARTFGLQSLVAVGAGVIAGSAAGLVAGPIVGSGVGLVTTANVRGRINEAINTDEGRKIDFMLSALDSRMTSEHEKEHYNEFRDSWLRKQLSGDPTYWGYRVGDHWLQDAVADSILQNTTVINGKFVNIQDFVRKKYESERYKGNAENVGIKGYASNFQVSRARAAVEAKIHKEIQEMKKTQNIYAQMTAKGDVYDIGIDLSTKEGQAELFKLSNTIHSYQKSTLGNIDESDKSIMRMNWIMAFFTQFKNWAFRVYGSRVSDLEYDAERGENTYGRYQAFGNAFKNATGTVITEMLANLGGLLAYVNPIAGVVGYGTSKFVLQDHVKYSVNLQEAGRDTYFKKKAEAIAEGKDMSHFPTEEEFIDLYINGVRNTLHALQQISAVFLAVSLIAAAGSGKDRRWYFAGLARLFFGLERELGGDKDPDQLSNLITGGGRQSIVPVIAYLSEIKAFITDFGKEAWGELEVAVGDKQHGEMLKKKAHPIHKGLRVAPFGVRELHFWLLTNYPEYAKTLEQRQPKETL